MGGEGAEMYAIINKTKMDGEVNRDETSSPIPSKIDTAAKTNSKHRRNE